MPKNKAVTSQRRSKGDPPLKARKRDAFVNLKVQSAQPMLIPHRPPLWGELKNRGLNRETPKREQKNY